MSSADPAARAATRPDVLAAGCVVLRKGRDGHQVLLVHRPRYDDWSFPKGKLDPGETLGACAVREVREESSTDVVLGLPLAPQRYPLTHDRAKTVHYWIARERHPGADEFVPNDEVDEIRWVNWADALALLSYGYDRETLVEARAQRRPTQVFVVLRQAQAEDRTQWAAAHPDRDDRERPLSVAGERQAAAAARALGVHPAGPLVASAKVRAVATALAAGGDPGRLTDVTAIRPDGFTPAGVPGLVQALLRQGPAVRLVAPRRIVPIVLDALGVADLALGPGEWCAVHHRGGEVLAVEVGAAV